MSILICTVTFHQQKPFLTLFRQLESLEYMGAPASPADLIDHSRLEAIIEAGEMARDIRDHFTQYVSIKEAS